VSDRYRNRRASALEAAARLGGSLSRRWVRLRRLGRVIAAELARQPAPASAPPAPAPTPRDAPQPPVADFCDIVEKLPDPVVIHRAGLIIYANGAMAAALRRDRSAALVGAELLTLVAPEDRRYAAEHLLTPFDPSQDPAPRDLRFTRADGSVALLEFAPIRPLADGEHPAVLAVAHDVSERVRLRDQLLRTDRLSSLGRLAAGVAHELNNPLAYVDLNLHLIDKALSQIAAQDVRRKAREALGAARHGVGRAKTIVRDLSTFSRPELETIEVLDLHPVIDAAIGMLGKQLVHRAHLYKDYQATARVLANRARLEQVFLNLILNAVQSFEDSDPGRNEIRVRTRDDAESRVVIDVVDNGVGISTKLQPRVFDPFYTTKPVGEGTGLGLAICHGIVHRLGGDITLESEAGRGSVFSVVLPADARRTSRPAPPRPVPPPAIRARILIIDDEPALASALRGLIEEHHDVVVVSSGRGALALLEKDRAFDLVLCDLMMVDLTGMDLYDHLRRVPPELSDRIIFMTGGAFTPRARAFLERVPNRCLEKPFRIDNVLSLIEEQVGQLPEL
jgi:PAS domain S-box-containing protein